MEVKYQNRSIIRRYVDILSDAGFKAVFGDQRNKDVLIDLINIVLPPHRKVADITYSTTEIPGFALSTKSVRLDLRCTAADNTTFIVEVQCYRQDRLFRRCVEYAAKVYDAGSTKGDGQLYDIPPVFFICLLEGCAEVADRSDPLWRDRFISEYTFREKVSLDVPDETIFCIFVELNRFDRELKDCRSVTEQWLYSLKRVGTLDRIPDELKSEMFERLFRACEIARFDKEQKLKYESDMITERDEKNIINTAIRLGKDQWFAEGLAEGEAKGLAEGKAKGRAEERIAIAGTLKQQGFPAATIAAATGMTEDEIESL